MVSFHIICIFIGNKEKNTLEKEVKELKDEILTQCKLKAQIEVQLRIEKENSNKLKILQKNEMNIAQQNLLLKKV